MSRSGTHMLVGALALLCVWTAASGLARAQVAVVAHPAVPVSSLERGELLDAYTGDVRYWHDGTEIVVFDLKRRGAVRDAFYQFLGITSSHMKTIWMKRLLTGEGDPPDAFDSEAALLDRVATTPGAIGYVSHALARTDDRVRILSVIRPEPAP